MKFNCKKFFSINFVKILIALIILIIITPLISLLFSCSCSYDITSASGHATSKSIATWGICPFTLFGIDKTCYGSDCFNSVGYNVYGILTGGCTSVPLEFPSGSSSCLNYLDRGCIGDIQIPSEVEFVIDLIFNLIISYLIACLLVFIYSKIKKAKQKK